MTTANVNRFTATTEEVFNEVRLACSPAERFLAEDEFFIHHERRFGHEEPFALTQTLRPQDPSISPRDGIARERDTNVA